MTNTATCSLNDAREILGVSEKTMRNYCKANKIPFFKERNLRGVMEYRFRHEDLISFLRQRSTGKKTPQDKDSLPVDGTEEITRTLLNKSATPVKESEENKQIVGRHSETLNKLLAGAHSGTEGHNFQLALLTQLIQENAFLKELLLEKEKQLNAKDSQLERYVEKISALSEMLATSARQNVVEKFP